MMAAQVVAASGSEGGSRPSSTAMVVTTIIAFALVYWVLNKYAFGPVLAVIDERRLKIDDDLKKAEILREQAHAEKLELDERLKHIEEEAREKMIELVNEGKRVSASIQEESRKQAEAMIEKAKQNIQFETEKARETLKVDIINLTLKATENLIRTNLDDAKQRDLINDFISQIERN
jgi:F-type H+-transporting ATPase subunit b